MDSKSLACDGGHLSNLAEKYAGIKNRFDTLLDSGDRTAALRVGMSLRELIFTTESDPEACRHYLFSSFFKRLDLHYSIQYQAYDFEVVDYQMQEFHKSRHLFRGPFPCPSDLTTGNYISVLGAAQLFGRFHQAYFPGYLAELGVSTPILNLSLGGAGPEYFTNPLFIDSVNKGKGCVLQVLSGRSVGTRMYPGMRMTRAAGETTSLEDRLEIYSRLWRASREEALTEVRECQSAYMKLMRDLLNSISVPVCLLWISYRKPNNWSLKDLLSGENPDFGLFPQLIDGDMWSDLASATAHSAIILDERDPSKSFVNQLTHKPCPVFSWTGDGTTMWTESYYPTQAVHKKISEAIAHWLDR